MRFTKTISIALSCFLLFSCAQKDKKSTAIFPAYKLIQDFSKKIKLETDLVLCAYGVNLDLPQDYTYQNRVANFSATYALRRTQKDTISLEYARDLIVSVTEILLK
jgi:hypothetical protein